MICNCCEEREADPRCEGQCLGCAVPKHCCVCRRELHDLSDSWSPGDGFALRCDDCERADDQQQEDERREDAIEKRIKHFIANVLIPALGYDVKNKPRALEQDFGSRYIAHDGLLIRVSDHEQKAGGGWDERMQEQHGEADVSFVIDETSPLPTSEEVLALIASKQQEC